MADLTYEIYVGGALASDEMYFWSDSAFEATTGGVLVPADQVNGLYWLTSPNVRPDSIAPGYLGMEPAADGSGNTINAFRWAYAGPPVQVAGVIKETVIRFFLRKHEYRLRWSDGTLLVGRWVGLPGYEFRHSEYVNPPISAVTQACRVSFGSTWWESGAQVPEHTYQLTDALGVATYYALVGVATGYDDGGWTWALDRPGVLGGLYPTHSNIALATNQHEMHPYVGILGAPAVDSGHYVGEYLYNTDTPHTAGWAMDYSGWNAGTGMLTYTDPAMETHSYNQTGRIRVRDEDNLPITATVSFGGGAYTGASDEAIAAVPKGSLLDDLRAEPGDADDPDSVPVLDSLPLRDATAYPASATEPDGPRLVPPGSYDGTLWGTDGPAQGQALRYPIEYAAKAVNTLTGVDGSPETRPEWAGLHRGLFEGGEVCTLPYDGTWTEVGGLGRSGTFKIWIHEDCDEVITVIPTPKSNVYGDLDYCLAPDGWPYGTECRGEQVLQYLSTNMEQGISCKQVMKGKGRSPSRQVLASHVHLLAMLRQGDFKHEEFSADFNRGGGAVLYRAYDGETFSRLSQIDATGGTAIRLREDPAGVLYCFIMRSGGDIERCDSADNGSTWAAAVTLTNLTGLTAGPFDARYDGRQWVVAAADGGGALHLYSSADTETYTDETEIAAAGTSPWLLPLEGEAYLCVYHDGADYVSDRVWWDGAAWQTSGPVSIVTATEKGMAAFRNDQKVVMMYSAGDGVKRYKSLDWGDTWSTGAWG